MNTKHSVTDDLRPTPDLAKSPLFDGRWWNWVRFSDVVEMFKKQDDLVEVGV